MVLADAFNSEAVMEPKPPVLTKRCVLPVSVPITAPAVLNTICRSLISKLQPDMDSGVPLPEIVNREVAGLLLPFREIVVLLLRFMVNDFRAKVVLNCSGLMVPLPVTLKAEFVLPIKAAVPFMVSGPPMVRLAPLRSKVVAVAILRVTFEPILKGSVDEELIVVLPV